MTDFETMTEAEKEKRSWWIPWTFVAFFVGLAIIDGTFVYLATSTHTGVVTQHAYEEGLAYNETVRDAEKQESLGWQGSISYAESGILSFGLTGRDGQPIAGASVKAAMSRPIEAGYEFEAALEEVAPGHYQIPVEFPLAGQWDVRLFVEWTDQTYQQHQRLVVRR